MQYQAATDSLKDRIILVTGAGDGIGKACAKAYAAHGATVILAGKTTAKLEAVYDEIEQAGHPQAAIYPINFEGASSKDYMDMAEIIDKEFGRLDGLHNNAAWLGTLTPVGLFDAEVWYKVMQINANAPFLLTRALLPLLQASDDASIVFTADKQDTAYWGAYGISKASMNSFINILGDELDVEKQIRVNGVNPGPVLTQIRRVAFPGASAEDTPQPNDVVAPFLYYMGPDSQGKTKHHYHLPSDSIEA